MRDHAPIRRALISVSDKTGLAALAAQLHARNVTLVSTGGSAAAIRADGLPVTEVSDLTGFPEMMDGRVKTLHPTIHGAILARRDRDDDRAAMETHGIVPFDLVVINLYPFEETVARGADADVCVENIDIGGPALIRAAAKNHRFVTVLTDPADYPRLADEMEQHAGGTCEKFRRRMAQAAFARTAAYDAAVSGWFTACDPGRWPRHLVRAGVLAQELRYGENPHQRAALYRSEPPRPGIANARQWQGKPLSYNNIADGDAALGLVGEFATAPACAIIKHANPCGVAQAGSLRLAYLGALACDRTSAFGGIIAFNRPLDADTAEEVVKIFTEVVIAPDATDEARAILAAKGNLRLLTTGAPIGPLATAAPPPARIHAVAGGFLVQEEDTAMLSAADLRPVTRREPSPAEVEDLLLAWKVVKHAHSNAIVCARAGATVGLGAGLTSRVEAAQIAAQKARAGTGGRGFVAASDAFFPFADGLEALAEAGATAVIQPGGAARDADVIAAADRFGLAMVFTGQRHFRH